MYRRTKTLMRIRRLALFLPLYAASLAQAPTTAGSLAAAVSNQTLLVDQASLVLDQLVSTLGTTRTALDQTDALLAGLETSLDTVQTDLVALGTSGAKFQASDVSIDMMGIPVLIPGSTTMGIMPIYFLQTISKGMRRGGTTQDTIALWISLRRIFSI